MTTARTLPKRELGHTPSRSRSRSSSGGTGGRSSGSAASSTTGGILLPNRAARRAIRQALQDIQNNNTREAQSALATINVATLPTRAYRRAVNQALQELSRGNRQQARNTLTQVPGVLAFASDIPGVSAASRTSASSPVRAGASAPAHSRSRARTGTPSASNPQQQPRQTQQQGQTALLSREQSITLALTNTQLSDTDMTRVSYQDLAETVRKNRYIAQQILQSSGRQQQNQNGRQPARSRS